MLIESNDLMDRLMQAEARLRSMALHPGTASHERERLRGKVEGVNLAISYLAEAERP